MYCVRSTFSSLLILHCIFHSIYHVTICGPVLCVLCWILLVVVPAFCCGCVAFLWYWYMVAGYLFSRPCHLHVHASVFVPLTWFNVIPSLKLFHEYLTTAVCSYSQWLSDIIMLHFIQVGFFHNAYSFRTLLSWNRLKPLRSPKWWWEDNTKTCY